MGISAVYRQWKAPGENPANSAEGIARQVRRLNEMIENWSKISNLGYEIMIAGDLNIDRHWPNDPLSRPELRALNPLLENLMVAENLTQMNFKPTQHQAGVNSILLDLFLTNIPERIRNVENFASLLSDHDGVKCVLHLKSDLKIAKSFIIRDFSRCSFNV